IGFGLNGTNLARAASSAGIPYEIIEMNPEIVRRERENGEPIHYGDAVHEIVLRHVRVENARVVVVAVSDPAGTRRITKAVRRLAPTASIIVRTRYVQEMAHLHRMGADEVIPEEFETSVEIFSRVLRRYLVPRDEIERFAAEVRADGYEMFRHLFEDRSPSWELSYHFPDIEVSTIRVVPGSSLVGASPEEIDFGGNFGISMPLMRRQSQTIANPGIDIRFAVDDLIVLLGPAHRLAEATRLFGGI
ncbi:MAG: NAD-binding protein, partial [bacterium]|nr:NAD-binding protein [bacterium]